MKSASRSSSRGAAPTSGKSPGSKRKRSAQKTSSGKSASSKSERNARKENRSRLGVDQGGSMRKLGVGGAAVVLALSVGLVSLAPAPASQIRNTRIYLGRSIGPFHLGMTLAAVKGILGAPPNDSGGPANIYGASWPGRGLHMLFNHRRLKYVRTNNAPFHTGPTYKGGVKIGSDAARVLTDFGDRPILCVPRHKEDGEGLQPPSPGVEYSVCVVYGPPGRATVFNLDDSSEVFIITVGFRRWLGPLGHG